LIVLSSQVFRAKELLDNTLAFIKNAISGAIVDPDRLVIGAEEGLFCLDLDRSGEFVTSCVPFAELWGSENHSFSISWWHGMASGSEHQQSCIT
jgi:hypothetical protein